MPLYRTLYIFMNVSIYIFTIIYAVNISRTHSASENDLLPVFAITLLLLINMLYTYRIITMIKEKKI